MRHLSLSAVSVDRYFRAFCAVYATACLLAMGAVASAADPVLATIPYGGGVGKNLPVTVVTSATESAIVFTTTAGDNPVIQFTCDQAWTWLAVPGGGSATASLPVAAAQTLTLQLDGGAGTTTQYVQRATANGNLKVTRVK